MDRGTRQAMVHGVAKSQIGPSARAVTALPLEKEFSSTLYVPSLCCIEVYRHREGTYRVEENSFSSGNAVTARALGPI